MKKLIYILLPALLTGCDDFTEVDLPNNQLTSSAVFESEATATAAMTDIYTKMREGGILSGNLTGISNQLVLNADELDFYAGPGSLSFAFSQNALQPAGVEVQELWNSTYSQIYAANAVLGGFSPSAGIRVEKKSQLTGEALLVRGLLHFYLAGLFGDVPYIKGTDYQVNRNVHRLPYTTVLEMTAEDLNQAAQLLPLEYVSADRTRPNRYAAYAYLARVRLYQGNCPVRTQQPAKL